jgi:hypothetical protein
MSVKYHSVIHDVTAKILVHLDIVNGLRMVSDKLGTYPPWYPHNGTYDL